MDLPRRRLSMFNWEGRELSYVEIVDSSQAFAFSSKEW